MLLECLRAGRRRAVIGTVADRAGALTERELAVELAGGTERQADDTAVRSTHVDLRHVHLPVLGEAGLVDWDEAVGTVSAGSHPVLTDPRFEALVAVEDDRVIEAVVDERRREILRCLEGRGETQTADLAREVAAREETGDPSNGTVAEVSIELHHVHLPKLSAAGLVEFDHDAGTVAAQGCPDCLKASVVAESDFDDVSPDDAGEEIKIP